jgi:hypothetical protein
VRVALSLCEQKYIDHNTQHLLIRDEHSKQKHTIAWLNFLLGQLPDLFYFFKFGQEKINKIGRKRSERNGSGGLRFFFGNNNCC